MRLSSFVVFSEEDSMIRNQLICNEMEVVGAGCLLLEGSVWLSSKQRINQAMAWGYSDAVEKVD